MNLLGYWGISGLAYSFIPSDECFEPCFVVSPNAQAMESVNIDVNRPKPQAENNICSLSVVWGICYSGGGGGGIKSVNKCGLQNMVSYQRLPSINFSLQSLSLK